MGLEGGEGKNKKLPSLKINGIDFSVDAQDTDFMLLHDRSLAMNSLLPYNRELESQLSSWFEKLLKVEISFELLPGKTVKIKAKNAYGETSFIKILKTESKQFLIATHSEHILFEFLNALARKEISLDDIVIYYFKNEKGISEITKLNIDEYGRVEGGLPGFFEQNIRNVIDYLDALDSKNEA